MSFEEEQQFEDEVRRIARAKWPSAAFAGAAMVQGRERDGIFEIDEVIHYVEATTSRRADKVRDDTKKIFSLISSQHRSGSMKGAVGWMVTKDEPTADQRDEARTHGKQNVKICSFSQFQQSIVDVSAYLALRNKHFFGSVVDPETRSLIPRVPYVDLDLTDATSGAVVSRQQIVNSVSRGDSYILLGDFGAGKSMTLRQLYFEFSDRYQRGGTPLFPIYINLREHSGQDDPSELLERHARRIGFEKPHSLVAAWRAGFAILLLDGFDEITTLGTTGFRTKLRETRRRSLEAVRRLVEQTPHSVGVVVAGREHFFNTPVERTSSLGLRGTTFTLTTNEFTTAQAKKYLTALHGAAAEELPKWIPGRPLIVGYMAARGLIQELQLLGQSVDPVDGWHALLDLIFSREARISANLEGTALRRILERLATLARGTHDGLGPLTPAQIRDVFVDICGTEPDEQANLILQRLPGLGVYRSEEDSRMFVDAELAGVCRAQDLLEFPVNPYGTLEDTGWMQAMAAVTSTIGDAAIQRIARDLIAKPGFERRSMEAAITALSQVENKTLAADVFAACLAVGHAPNHKMYVDDAFFENFTFHLSEQSPDLSNVEFRNCYFDTLEIDGSPREGYLPRMKDCVVGFVHGRAGRDDLPKLLSDPSNSFEVYRDTARTQSEIMSTSLTKGEKVVLAILRKLFVQGLSGRAESALSRGLDLNDRQLVPSAIKLIQQHGFALNYNRGDGNVWIPERKNIGRARRMLNNPSTCGEALLQAAKSGIR
jgi:hypothetical protein